MKASDVMTRHVVTVRADASVVEAGRLMIEKEISGLPVVDGGDGHLVGIVTERDFLRRAEMGNKIKRPRWFEVLIDPAQSASQYDHFRDLRIEEVMTRDTVTVTEDRPLEEVARLISERDIKRVPVMRGDQLVGIVSRLDLVRALTQATRDVSDSTSETSAVRRRMAELERQAGCIAQVADTVLLLGFRGPDQMGDSIEFFAIIHTPLIK
ncbi:MAG: CBS domain-containing protein [Xanthobacteraceae bacterium]